MVGISAAQLTDGNDGCYPIEQTVSQLETALVDFSETTPFDLTLGQDGPVMLTDGGSVTIRAGHVGIVPETPDDLDAAAGGTSTNWLKYLAIGSAELKIQAAPAENLPLEPVQGISNVEARVRAEPNTDSAQITTLGINEAVVVMAVVSGTDPGFEWYRVRVTGTGEEGFVRSDLMTVSDQAALDALRNASARNAAAATRLEWRVPIVTTESDTFDFYCPASVNGLLLESPEDSTAYVLVNDALLLGVNGTTMLTMNTTEEQSAADEAAADAILYQFDWSATAEQRAANAAAADRDPDYNFRQFYGVTITNIEGSVEMTVADEREGDNDTFTLTDAARSGVIEFFPANAAGLTAAYLTNISAEMQAALTDKFAYFCNMATVIRVVQAGQQSADGAAPDDLNCAVFGEMDGAGNEITAAMARRALMYAVDYEEVLNRYLQSAAVATATPTRTGNAQPVVTATPTGVDNAPTAVVGVPTATAPAGITSDLLLITGEGTNDAVSCSANQAKESTEFWDFIQATYQRVADSTTLDFRLSEGRSIPGPIFFAFSVTDENNMLWHYRVEVRDGVVVQQGRLNAAFQPIPDTAFMDISEGLDQVSATLPFRANRLAVYVAVVGSDSCDKGPDNVNYNDPSTWYGLQ